MERKIFLENLPRWDKEGKGIEGSINWEKSINHKVHFIYKDIEGDLDILAYNKDIKSLLIKYNNDKLNIMRGNFMKCKIGNLIGTKTLNFKIKIGTKFKDKKRDINITDREYIKDKNGRSRKYYKYTCNNCGWTDGRIAESDLLNKNNPQGCSCCRGLTVVEGINDIPTVAPWLIPYFQGGYDEAKLYTKSSGKSIYPICPDCGRVKDKLMNISTIYKNHSIGCVCNDNISFGEKFVYNELNQLGLNFEYHKTFEWSKNIYSDIESLCGSKEYDFYFEVNNEKYICEVNGLQHYEEGFERIKSIKKARKLKEEQENDILKKELAIKNGIKEENYIVIDCRESTLEWIKDNENGILSSRFSELFDLSIIDWLKCNEFTCTNLVKIVCELKSNNTELTTTDISKMMKLSSDTIRVYLKRGNNIWCNYDAEKELKTSASKNGIKSRKEVEVFKNKKSLGIFESLHYLEDNSLKLFGTKFTKGNMSKVCNGKQSEHKGFTFKYVEYQIAC
jgi:hypothetical protein